MFQKSKREISTFEDFLELFKIYRNRFQLMIKTLRNMGVGSVRETLRNVTQSKKRKEATAKQ